MPKYLIFATLLGTFSGKKLHFWTEQNDKQINSATFLYLQQIVGHVK